MIVFRPYSSLKNGEMAHNNAGIPGAMDIACGPQLTRDILADLESSRADPIRSFVPPKRVSCPRIRTGQAGKQSYYGTASIQGI